MCASVRDREGGREVCVGGEGGGRGREERERERGRDRGRENRSHALFDAMLFIVPHFKHEKQKAVQVNLSADRPLFALKHHLLASTTTDT